MSVESRTAVFARPDHPRGYGQGERAHGYSILLVSYAGDGQLAELRKRLAYAGTRLPDGQRLQIWYSGRFDLLFTFQGPAEREFVESFDRLTLSLGDNRSLAAFSAEEVLDEPSLPFGWISGEVIVEDPEVKDGAPIIKGTRLTVAAVAARIAGGDSIEQVAEDYPYLAQSDLEAALDYHKAHTPRK